MAGVGMSAQKFADDLPTLEDELEAAVWSAIVRCEVTTNYPLEFMLAVKIAAMAYAAGDSEVLTAARRAVLERHGPGSGAVVSAAATSS